MKTTPLIRYGANGWSKLDQSSWINVDYELVSVKSVTPIKLHPIIRIEKKTFTMEVLQMPIVHLTSASHDRSLCHKYARTSHSNYRTCFPPSFSCNRTSFCFVYVLGLLCVIFISAWVLVVTAHSAIQDGFTIWRKKTLSRPKSFPKNTEDVPKRIALNNV